MGEFDDRIHSKLKAQLWLMRGHQFLRIGLGVPLTLLGPLVLGSILWYVGGHAWLGSWTMCVGAMAAVLIPLLLRLESRTRGNYLGEALAQSQGIAGEEAMVIEAMGLDGALYGIARNPRVPLAGIVEIFLIGPRMLLGAWRDARIARRCRGNGMRIAARIVETLYRARVGIPLRKLVAPGEHLTDLIGPLTYLAYHQWIGVAASGEKAWLPADVAQRIRP